MVLDAPPLAETGLEGCGDQVNARLAPSHVDLVCLKTDSTIMNWQDIITFEGNKRSGKPCIRGLRITVYDILEYLASGMSPADIIADFTELSLNDIQAVLAFAADRERRLPDSFRTVSMS